MRLEWLALGLVLIILGVLFSSASALTTPKTNYISVDVVVNTYVDDNPLKTTVSGEFAAGDRLFFNFTKGRYWATTFQTFRTLNPGFSWTNYSIPDYKMAVFDIYCPSGDFVEVGVYVVAGEMLYATTYSHHAEDFTPLEGGNLTFTNAGIEGITNRAGTYTIEAYDLDPASFRLENESYGMSGDPPRMMYLWVEDIVQTQPYFSFLPLGVVLASSGVVISAWAAMAKKIVRTRRSRPNRSGKH